MASQPEPQPNEERRSQRCPFDAQVQFRAGTRKANVKVRDMSQLGARIAGVFLVHQGERFWLKLGNLEPIEAKVIWTEDFEFGCEFVRPLNQVVFDAILRAS